MFFYFIYFIFLFSSFGPPEIIESLNFYGFNKIKVYSIAFTFYKELFNGSERMLVPINRIVLFTSFQLHLICSCLIKSWFFIERKCRFLFFVFYICAGCFILRKKNSFASRRYYWNIIIVSKVFNVVCNRFIFIECSMLNKEGKKINDSSKPFGLWPLDALFKVVINLLAYCGAKHTHTDKIYFNCVKLHDCVWNSII